MRDFNDRVVVVTAAGSGIGRATAKAFAQAGARVHLVDVVPDRVAEATTELTAAGRRATGHVVDCTSSEAVAELAAEVVAAEGRVDVLQNGVGALLAAPAEELSAADWHRHIDLNIGSVVNGIAAFLPVMLEGRGRSHIVNIASVAGLVGFPYTAPYCATKFAIVGLSEALSFELAGRGIGVTAVCPGMVRSNLVADGQLRLPGPWPALFDWAYAHLAADPERVAQAVLRAVARNESLVTPAPLLPLLWRLKRLGGPQFLRGAREATRLAQWLGSLRTRPKES
ncbi:MAG: SDR family oxidoreductase [Deltaproteobacteria bacterium]|nr:SDR family oxidoreductase [Deltaproteobacteria bacterium]